jgi:oxaloacetate decarboxylase alpha subunit
VEVKGQSYTVTVAAGGDISAIGAIGAIGDSQPQSAGPQENGEPIPAPLSGNVIKVVATVGQNVNAGDPVLVLEAMKMETNISSPKDGIVSNIAVREGDSVTVGDTLFDIA